MYHTQCRLKKKTKTYETFQTSWIPKKFAKKGKFIKLKDDDGWEVVEVYATMLTKDVQKNERNYTHHRKATDI